MRILLIISVLFNVAFNQCLGDFDENGLLDILDIVSIVNQIMEGNDECIDEGQYGCTDILACNYDSGATIDNGSCIYSNDQLCGECDNAGIEYPDYYEFNDYNGNSTVRYSGQVVRNIIVDDMKDYVYSNPEFLVSMYENDETNLAREISFLPEEVNSIQVTYGDISTSRLSNKIAQISDNNGVSNIEVYGYNMEPDQLMMSWFESANSGTYTLDGLNLAHMIQKGLLGMVIYYQGISKYLGNLFLADNSEPYGDNYYTQMEHYWDESFGYFGASKDYLYRNFSEVMQGYNDTNNDNLIDFLSEVSTGYSVITVKRDNDSFGHYNFKDAIVNAYLNGRTQITCGGSEAEIDVQRQIIINNWEKVIAATTIHYINDTINDIDDSSQWVNSWDSSCIYTHEICADYSKHFSKMRATAIALQYNRYKMISDSDLYYLYDLMQTAPIFPSQGDLIQFKSELLIARDILQTVYGFDSNVVNEW